MSDITSFLIYVYNTFVYNIYEIVLLIIFDIPRFSVNDLHQIQVAAPSPSSRKLQGLANKYTNGDMDSLVNYINVFLCECVKVYQDCSPLTQYLTPNNHCQWSSLSM